MTETRAYHGLDFTIARNGCGRICYVLLPEGLHSDGLKMMEACALKYSCNIVLITGMDWNKDLTPWPAPGVFKKEKPFEGKAGDFLKELLTDYFPGIESILGLNHPERYLVGISLSGLFAIWTLFQTDEFRSIASISGSLWYDGFVDWVRTHEMKNGSAAVHLSLGDREKNSKNLRMSQVEDATATVTHMLVERGCSVDLRMIQGTHFSPITPRLEMAFDNILSSPEIQ